MNSRFKNEFDDYIEYHKDSNWTNSLIQIIDNNPIKYFDFEVNDRTFHHSRFPDKGSFKKEILKVINNIRKIKTLDLIKEYEKTLDLTTEIIKDNYNKELDIILDNSHPSTIDTYYTDNPKNNINDLILECKTMLELLYKYKNEKYLYKILIDIFKNNCADYSVFNKYIID